MNTEILTRWITLGANIGVISSIVFLGFEVRQNNELLAVQVNLAQLSVQRDRRSRVIENVGNLAEMVIKDRDGVGLTDMEFERLSLHYLDTVDSWEWEFREYQAGRLSEDVMDIDNWRTMWSLYPTLRNSFEETKDRRSEAFLLFVQDRVLSSL
jgi:hypothetical protein